MRKIKFRAWGPNSKYMWSWGELVANDISMRWMQPSFGEKVLMQFTGLLDKSGKEIYEGDILRSLKNCLYHDGYEVGEVTFKNGCFLVRNSNLYTMTQAFEPVVIGNIYENPDLLGDSDA